MTVPRVYIFHFRDGHTETLIGASASQALLKANDPLEYVVSYEAPGDERVST